MNNPEKSQSAQAQPPSYAASPMQMGSPMIQQSSGPMSPQPQYASALHHQPPPFAQHQQMFAQPQYAASPQFYGQQQVESVDDEVHPECRVIGFITAPILAILWLLAAEGIFKFSLEALYAYFYSGAGFFALAFAIFLIVAGFGSLLVFVFHIIVCVPGYASGSPKWTKFIPALLGTVLTILPFTLWSIGFLIEGKFFEATVVSICGVLIPILLTTFSYFSYMGDDESDSCWLQFKTSTNKKPESKMVI